ncbi:MAG: hypothetical protein MUE49_14380, partial [Rhodospirillales bacterium]|nr:hypothetical protein [Rhodospirillales bacterium]
PDETCVIERREEDAHVIDGAACAANDWQAPGWSGRPRGEDSPGRRASLRTITPALDGAFAWLQAPVLNDWTRLAVIADAAADIVIAQGYEDRAPVTAVLRCSAAVA